jgi:magnesium transporter
MTASVGEIDLNDLVERHMRPNITPLRTGQTVGEAIDTLRSSPPPARIVYFYVVDENERLKGVIPSRSLLLSPPEALLDDVMLRRVVAVPAGATVLDACEFFVLHRFLAFPVIDPEGRLVGAIDVELYTDELRDLGEGQGEQGDDLFQLVGIHLARAKQRSPIRAFRTRFPWLMCNITGGIAAAFLCGLFEEQLQQAVALALFIPVVLALAESVSIQSVSLAIQMLRGSPTTSYLMLRRLHAELTVGLMLGVASGLFVGLVALVWLHKTQLALSVAGGIIGGVATAAVLGAVVPNLLRRSKLDPHLAAGPVVLAVTDVITLLCYFNIARWLLG